MTNLFIDIRHCSCKKAKNYWNAGGTFNCIGKTYRLNKNNVDNYRQLYDNIYIQYNKGIMWV